VCYREADEGQLEAFVEEVTKEGRMTENTKLFLDKLDEKKEDTTKDIAGNKSDKVKRDNISACLLVHVHLI